LGEHATDGEEAEPSATDAGEVAEPPLDALDDSDVRIIQPAAMEARAPASATAEPPENEPGQRGVSIFETPDNNGQFGESLISDKSLDEVILTYLQDDLDE